MAAPQPRSRRCPGIRFGAVLPPRVKPLSLWQNMFSNHPERIQGSQSYENHENTGCCAALSMTMVVKEEFCHRLVK